MMCGRPDSWHLILHGSHVCSQTLATFTSVAMQQVAPFNLVLMNAGSPVFSVSHHGSRGFVVVGSGGDFLFLFLFCLVLLCVVFWQRKLNSRVSRQVPASELHLEPQYLKGKISINFQHLLRFFFSTCIFLLVLVILFKCACYIF